MVYFILNTILWTMAFYGIIELAKQIFNSIYKGKKEYLIILVKNEEKNIEWTIRKILIKIKMENIKNIEKIIIIDLGSNDNTKEILEKIEKDYAIIKFVDIESKK